MDKKEYLSEDKALFDIFIKLSKDEPLSATEEEKMDKYIQRQGLAYNKSADEIATTIGTSQKWLGGQYVESIRVMAITAGALASFSILLLSSGVIEKETSLLFLILGAILSLVVVILSFGHLFNNLSIETKELQNFREKALTPMQTQAFDAVNCLMGDLTRKEWLGKEKAFLENSKDIRESSDDTKRKLSHFDELVLGVFILAVSLIIFSLASTGLVPYVTKIISFFYFNQV